MHTKQFPLNNDTRANILERVPWDSNHGYTTMLRYPKSKSKGVLHIASFDFSERGLPGKGIYAGEDAIAWLRNWTNFDDMKSTNIVEGGC